MIMPNNWDRIFDELMFELSQLGSICVHKWDPYRTLEFKLNQKEYRVEITGEINHRYKKKYVRITVKESDGSDPKGCLVLTKRQLYQELGI